MEGGHYYAHCRHGGKWYKVNDTLVEEEPLTFEDAYMLFYERSDAAESPMTI